MITRFNSTAAAFLTAVGAASVFATAASAQYAYPYVIVQGRPAPNVHIEHVAYGDLNLTTRAGREALKLRVSHAVERVCLYDAHRSYMLGEPAYTQCAAKSWSHARPQMIGAIYRARQYAAYYRY